MTYKCTSGQIGVPPIELAVAVPASLSALPCSAGLQVTAEDKVWGPGEFMFARASAAIRQYGLCCLTQVWDATNKVFTWNMGEAPSTTIMGRPVYVSMAALTTGQYGWFMQSGVAPVNCNASVAADTTFAIAATGQGGALAAGKQVVNARIITAGTQTVTATGSGISGDNVINLSSTDGFILGGVLTGTGVGASAKVSFIDPMGRYVIVTVVNSGAVSGTITCTYNDATIFFNVATLNQAFAQGAIT